MKPFRTLTEENHIVDADETPPALVFSPAATPSSIVGALQMRTASLSETLRLWAMVEGEQSHLRVGDAVQLLVPMAEEIDLLADALRDRLASRRPASPPPAL